jgi:hypothetical protein
MEDFQSAEPPVDDLPVRPDRPAEPDLTSMSTPAAVEVYLLWARRYVEYVGEVELFRYRVSPGSYSPELASLLLNRMLGNLLMVWRNYLPYPAPEVPEQVKDVPHAHWVLDMVDRGFDAVRKRYAEEIGGVQEVMRVYQESIAAKAAPITLVPEGFQLLGGGVESLPGKPLAMLQAIMATRHRRMTATDILKTLWRDNFISNPEQAVKDTASKLRLALRDALRRTGIAELGDPLPSTGQGADLTYQLDLSAIRPK